MVICTSIEVDQPGAERDRRQSEGDGVDALLIERGVLLQHLGNRVVDLEGHNSPETDKEQIPRPVMMAEEVALGALRGGGFGDC